MAQVPRSKSTEFVDQASQEDAPDKPTWKSRILDILQGAAQGASAASRPGSTSAFAAGARGLESGFESAKAGQQEAETKKKQARIKTALTNFKNTDEYKALPDSAKTLFESAEPSEVLSAVMKRDIPAKTTPHMNTVNISDIPGSKIPKGSPQDRTVNLTDEQYTNLFKPKADKPAIPEGSDERLFADFGKQFANPSSRSAMGVNQQKLNNIGAAKALIKQVEGQPGGADQRQMFEIALATTRSLVGNNMLTEGEVNKMMPSTFRGSFDKFLERVQNEPKGIDAQAFVQRFKDTIAREEKVATEQLDSARGNLLDPYAPTLRRHKADVQNLLKKNRIYDEEFNPDKSLLAPDPAILGAGKTPAGDGGTGKVKVTNGKETLSIDAADVAEATKDGYKVVP